MNCSHRLLSNAEYQLDELTNSSGLRIAVNRLGAELISLQKQSSAGDWKPFLWRDNDTTQHTEGWANHATVMGYFTHRIWNEQSNYQGHIVHGSTHGFIRHHAFQAPTFDSTRGSLTYHLPADQIPPEAYPYRVSLNLTYRLVGDQLEVLFEFINEENHECHLSFGWHPGFAVTDLHEAQILLPPGTYYHHLAPGNFLNQVVKPIPHSGGQMPFATNDLPISFLLELKDVPNRVFRIEDPASGRSIELDFGNCPYATLWSDGHPFVCIEPCWGLPDNNPPLPFENKVGIQTIPANGTLTTLIRVKPHAL